MIRVLLLVPIALVSFLLILFAKSEYNEFRRQDSWVTISASIISAEINSQRRSNRKTSNCPLVKVSYFVKNKEFISNLRIGQYPCSLFPKAVKRDLNEFPVGEDIDVLLNPMNSNEVRASTYSLGFWFYVLVACIVAVSGAFFGILFCPANQFRGYKP